VNIEYFRPEIERHASIRPLDHASVRFRKFDAILVDVLPPTYRVLNLSDKQLIVTEPVAEWKKWQIAWQATGL